MYFAAKQLLALNDERLHNEAALEAALATVPPPRTPEILLEKLAGLGVRPGQVVVDLGCGSGQYAVRITSATGCDVVALDLSRRRVAETLDAARRSGEERVHVACAAAEAVPLRDRSADFIWCRDMLNHVDLAGTMRRCAEVLVAGGRMVVYQSFATELLEPQEARRLYSAFAIVAANMDAGYFDRCALEAGFRIAERDVIGSEWRELWEVQGGAQQASVRLMRAAQLLRGGDAVRKRLGDEAFEFALADQLWGVYQMIGKLQPTCYVLQNR